MTNSEFSRLLEAALNNSRRDLPEQLASQVSLSRAVRKLCKRESMDGAEAEAHIECCRRDGIKPEAVSGLRIPWGSLLTRGQSQRMQRDLQVNVFNQGGATVATEIAEPIEILLNRSTFGRMGARKITGLTGNVAFPRVTAAPTAYSLPETGVATKSDTAFDQPTISPRRITATENVSQQLLIQSSIGIEDYLRQLLGDILILKADQLAYYGQGSASEPTGVLNLPGVGSVIFGGAASYSSIVQFETSLASANADATNGRFGYVTSPLTKGKWKTTARALTGASTVSALPLWEDGPYGSPDGKVNGYAASATNQIENNQVFFGNFADAAICVWGSGPDLIVNPYTLATSGEVTITLHLYFDVLFRHSPSWCVSADAGNQ